MAGTITVSLILLSVVAAIIASMIHDKHKGRHPSCGGNCGSCGHACTQHFPNATAFLKNHQ